MLKITSFGRSKSRVVFIHTSKSDAPLRIAGTRWIAIGSDAADQLIAKARASTEAEFNAHVPGGCSAATFGRIKAGKVEKPTHTWINGFNVDTFGSGNSRVTLLRAGGSAPAVQRIGQTTLFAINPYTKQSLKSLISGLGGGVNTQATKLSDLLSIPIGGGTYNRILKAYA